jgi:hypothetical protein
VGPGGGSIQETPPEATFDPLHDCPTKPRYERTAQRARDGSAFQAVKLKCLDCSGWYYTEAKTCEIRTCALWLLNRRIFKGGK